MLNPRTGDISHLLDVRAGREYLFPSCDHHSFDTIVIVCHLELGVELSEELGGKGVERFGAVEGEDGYILRGGAGGENEGFGWGGHGASDDETLLES